MIPIDHGRPALFGLMMSLTLLCGALMPRSWSRPEPLERAFENIQRGMSEADLFALMEAYRHDHSDHRQWQSWSEGRTNVSVMIWPDRDLGDGVFRVHDVDIRRTGLDEHGRVRSVAWHHDVNSGRIRFLRRSSEMDRALQAKKKR